MTKHLIVLSAPSGAGKTTVARHLLEAFPSLTFSVSATTRDMRPGEEDGTDYVFLSREEFKRRVASGDLIEYEEIFGNYYGTLRSVVQESLARFSFVVFDVDVKGALSLRSAFPDNTLLVFIGPPDMKTLEQRLRKRMTETDEQIALRLARAEMEMAHTDSFDVVIINRELQVTLSEAEEVVRRNILGSQRQQTLFDS